MTARRPVLAALLAAAVLLPVAPAPAAPAPTSPAAVWVWTPPRADRLLDAVRRTGFEQVFLATPASGDAAGARRVRRGVRALHDAGVGVTALGGGTSWARHPDRAVDWARSALRLAPFDGLHLDVEPHGLPGWSEPATRARLVRAYLRMLDRVVRLGVPVVVDVQMSYGAVAAPGGGSFADAVLDRVDGVTVMSYRDTARGPNGLLAVSRDWLRRGARAGVPVQLGVETNPSSEGEHVSFAEEGSGELLRVVGVVDDRLRGSSSYAGTAVHDLAGWQALPTAAVDRTGG